MNPAALEVCDARDNDCNSQTDEAGVVTLRGATYSTITDALVNAVNGDTVEVCSGTYTENIAITREVALVGTLGPSVTSIESNTGAPTVSIDADNVSIRGMSLTGVNTAGASDVLTGGGALQAPNAENLALDEVWLLASSAGACGGRPCW